MPYTIEDLTIILKRFTYPLLSFWGERCGFNIYARDIIDTLDNYSWKACQDKSFHTKTNVISIIHQEARNFEEVTPTKRSELY